MSDANIKSGRLLSAALLACLVLAMVAEVPLGSLLVMPLVLYLPGHIVLRHLRTHATIDLEHILFAFGLSVATVIASGFLLHMIGFMSPIAWAAFLLLIPAIAAVANKKPQGWLEIRKLNWDGSWAISGREALMLTGAAALAICAFVIDRQEALVHAEFKFTEFWMVSKDPANPNSLTIGVKNSEGDPASYEVEVMVNGQIAARLPTISLLPGETWTSAFNTAFRADGMERVEAWIFKNHDHRTVYRRVWADIGRILPGEL